jgi:copper chaperone
MEESGLIEDLPESDMGALEVDNMTCGHCASSITKAVRSVDRGAEVRIDLAGQRVQIDRTQAGTGELARAIKDAGYTPVEAAGTAAAPAATPSRSGCRCR